MLIPAFGSLGSGIAQYLQIRRVEKGGTVYNPAVDPAQVPGGHNTSLPAAQTEWAASESRYKTGDLVPPSVTDGTTRHLEMDSEGKTMTLPKK